ACPAQAQSGEPAVQITAVDNSNFPEIALDYKGINLVEPLPADTKDIEIIEDGQTITPDSLEYHYQGVHFAVAINPDSSLSIRGPKSNPYNLAMVEALKTVGPEPENARNNRYSYFNNPELGLVETDIYVDWVELVTDLETLKADQNSSLSSLELAVSALEHSSLDLDTVLVYITPYLDYRLLPEFYALLNRAGQLGVETHVWIVMSRRVIGSSYEIEMRTAIQESGGSLHALTGEEAVPNPQEYMVGKGQAFTARYQSLIRESGDYDVQVRVNFEQSPALQSAPATLPLDVRPTRLTFINPPENLEILYNNDGSFQPAQLPLEVLIEFQDGYPRQILNSTLFVNGEKVASNTQPPYGSFVLGLEDFVEQEELRLEVRLQDEFGLQGRTPVHTVVLDLFQPEKGVNEDWFTSPWIWLALLALGGLIAFLVFRKPLPTKKMVEKTGAEESETEKSVERAPVATPLLVKSYGSLIRLDPDQTPSAEKPYLLTEAITLIGRDPGLANLVLDLPSIEPLHAEIHFFPDGRIRLTDFNSTSGSYVNFKPVGTHGVSLQHADLVHFGGLLFRFNSATRTQNASTKTEQEI
ncbi:MAG TPA: FHA domain-containing protein, partial [Anaerolineaceae bacterium]|nr:FHA domain-containing protein [Anaerolineaceae bacterium]